MRGAALLLIAAGCAATPAKVTWPKAPAPAGREDSTLSVAAGGPLDEGMMIHRGPPVEIEYEPFFLPGRRENDPSSLVLTWPLPATGVTSLYGKRSDPIDGQVRFHRGLDMEAKYGTTVKASADGQVVAAGWNGGYGRQIVIEHAGGYQTVYAHLAQILVPLRARVAAGEPIGLVGTSGRSTGAHLHFEVLEWGQHVDPLDVLGVELRLK